MAYLNQKTDKRQHTRTEIGGALITVSFSVLLILKLTAAVSWPWWVITLPVWIVPAVLFVVVIGAFSYGVIRELWRQKSQHFNQNKPIA